MNLASFDLNLLLVLEALLQERSATRAGKRVGLSQSAVSNALARLRSALHDPLFVRGSGSMTPTAFALTLAIPVHEALDRLRDALGGRPAFDAASSTYRARIGTTDYGELIALTPLMRRLRREAPGVTLACKRLAWAFELPLAALEKGELELALGHFGRIPPAHGMRSLRILSDRWVILRDGRARRLSVDAFAASPQTKVMYGADGPGIVGEALMTLGKARVTPVVTPHFATVAHYVKGTDILGIVPERLARLQARSLGLSITPAPIALPPIELSLVWHERHDGSAPHAWLRALAARVTKGRVA